MIKKRTGDGDDEKKKEKRKTKEKKEKTNNCESDLKESFFLTLFSSGQQY